MLTALTEPLWIRQLSVHQDYGWFLVLLGWGFALVFWRWHPARRDAWPWLPWVAGACALGAAVQFAIFSPPFDFFHSRLIPGTVANYRPELIEPQLLGEWLLASLFAAMLAGWGWQEAARRGRNGVRWIALVAPGIALWLHINQPAIGGLLLASLAMAAAATSWRRTPRSAGRIALAGAALIPLLSTLGPVAVAAGLLQRGGPPTPMGLFAALTQGLAAGAAIMALAPGVLSRRAGLGWGTRWKEARWATVAAIVWLVGGITFAHLTGRDNRAELHQNRLRVAAARATLFERDALRLLDRPLPTLREIEWREPGDGVAHVPESDVRAGREIAQLLLRERLATPFINGARLVVATDGWLIALASSRALPEPGILDVIRRLTPRDLEDWNAARNVVETSPVAEIGRPYFCRAAIVAADGRMLGWLEFEQEEFFQSIERKWRSGPLLVTALGLILGATLLFQRRAEREREQAMRTAAIEAEASRVKSAFLATVSHELRTPLQSLLGYSELLRQRMAHDAQAQHWLGAVQQHGQLMTRLVNDLIDLGAIDAGTFRLAPRAVAPGDLVCATVEGLRAAADAKRLGLSCRIEASVPATVSIDAERLRQIVLNLTGNAVKFTDAGRVDVSLRADVAAGDAHDASVLVLEVADTGPGIAPEAQARLFTPFSRLEATSHKEGAGLGLALTAALCRAMGGDVRVESDGRTGSIFTATFTAAKAETTGGGAAAPGKRPEGLRGLRVLIVDDNALVRDLFVAMLQQAGAVCSVAASAESALATARHGNIDAIVLDLSLPGMSGVELAPRLRELLPAARIVGASAHAAEPERRAALAAGMHAFLSKPVSQAELIAALAGAAAPVGAVTSGSAAPWRAELEERFRAEAGAAVVRADAALAARDWRALRAAAHHLANSAAAVQDRVLLAACESVVRAAEAGDAEAAARTWTAARATLARRAGA